MSGESPQSVSEGSRDTEVVQQGIWPCSVEVDEDAGGVTTRVRGWGQGPIKSGTNNG